MTTGFFDYLGKQDQPTIKPHGLFSRFHDGDWQKVGEFGAVRHYASGAKIFAADSAEAAMFFISSGTVELTMDNPGAFNGRKVEIGPGSVFGILSFFDGQTRGVKAVARGPVETLMLDKAMLERLAAWHPRIAMIILQDVAEVIAQKLRQHDPLI